MNNFNAKVASANFMAAQKVIADADDLKEIYAILGEAVGSMGRAYVLAEEGGGDEVTPEEMDFSYFYASTLLLVMTAYIKYRQRQPGVTDLRSVQLGMKLELEALHSHMRAKHNTEVKT